MHTYLIRLVALFRANADPRNAAPMKRYMREQFDYLGIKSPRFKALMKQHLN